MTDIRVRFGGLKRRISSTVPNLLRWGIPGLTRHSRLAVRLRISPQTSLATTGIIE